MIKKIFYLVIFVSLIIIDPVKADEYYNAINTNNPSEIEEYKNYDYVIDKYNIEINVNENNTLNITENILAVFTVPKHGIIRNIPLENNVKRTDGTTTTNRTQVSNVTVNDNFNETKEDDMYVLKIGNANQTITGNKEYVIKYTYNLGPDPLKNLDEFYFNIIGDSWDTAIGNVTFKITMPKTFDASKLGFSSGYYGSTNNEYIEYKVQGNIITGKYKGILRPNQALTIRLELNEGYFVNAHLNISPFTFLMYLIPAICLALVIFLWHKHGKDEMIIETVEFYPPDDLNSLEIACLYKGHVNADDVVSLLIYLAAKGYLKIEENNIDLDSKKIKLSDEKMQNAQNKIKELETQIALEKKENPNSAKLKILRNSLEIYKNIDKPISEELTNEEKNLLKDKINDINDINNITFIKLKDYDGQNIYEEIFFNGIFENGCKTRKLKALKSSFYRKIGKIISMVQKKYQNKAFEKNKPQNTIIIILAIIASVISILFIPIYYNMGFYGLFAVSVILAFLTPFFIVGFIKHIPLVFKIFWFAIIGYATYTIMSLLLKNSGILSEPVYVGGLLAGIACIIIMIVCLLNMPKRSNYGNQMKGRIKGFRNFLETVEKDKLEQMVEKNPTYFYDILPFTYVLGISDIWINKFETIGLPDVTWYNASSNINDFMSHQIHNISSTLSYNPTSYSSDGFSSSSSSSSGGGSSGGGSGGGGGSSW